MNIVALNDTAEKLATMEWVQLKCDNESLEKGYREHQYKLLGKVAALVAKLELDERLYANFSADIKEERETQGLASEKTLLAAVLAFVMAAKSNSQRKIVWKRARAIEFLSTNCSVLPDDLPEALRMRGGIEAVVRQASVEAPMRLKSKSSKESRNLIQHRSQVNSDRCKKNVIIKLSEQAAKKINRIDVGKNVMLFGALVGPSEGQQEVLISDLISYDQLSWG